MANAVAKIGANVETDPSINPASPGCTTRSRKLRDESSLLLTAWNSSASCPLTVSGVSSINLASSEALSSLSGTDVWFSTLLALFTDVFCSPGIAELLYGKKSEEEALQLVIFCVEHDVQ